MILAGVTPTGGAILGIKTGECLIEAFPMRRKLVRIERTNDEENNRIDCIGGFDCGRMCFP
jgi:hypothetical protein